MRLMHSSGFQCRSCGLEWLKPCFPQSSSHPCVGSNLTSLGIVFSWSSSVSLPGQLQRFLRSLFLWSPTSSPTPLSRSSFHRQHPFLLFHHQPSALHSEGIAVTRHVRWAGQALCFSQRNPCSPDHSNQPPTTSCRSQLCIQAYRGQLATAGQVSWP